MHKQISFQNKNNINLDQIDIESMFDDTINEIYEVNKPTAETQTNEYDNEIETNEEINGEIITFDNLKDFSPFPSLCIAWNHIIQANKGYQICREKTG